MKTFNILLKKYNFKDILLYIVYYVLICSYNYLSLEYTFTKRDNRLFVLQYLFIETFLIFNYNLNPTSSSIFHKINLKIFMDHVY